MTASPMETDQELRTALKVFGHFFDVLGQPLSVINHTGEHLYYNQENAALDECQQHEILGKPMQTLFPAIREEDNEMLSALRRGEEFINHQKSYYTPGGRLIDYQHTTVPLYNSAGEIMGVIESGQDLSRYRTLQRQVSALNEKLFSRQKKTKHRIIHSSARMREVLSKAERLAISDVPVVITGETGTGKELLADFIHRQSSRQNKPFIALNCSALPVSLIESTLFGSVKGAFTGAENSSGYFELAHGGTLFLDELNTMPVEIQGKILRFLQTKTFWKVGGNKEQNVDIRIISAMNESPFEMIRQKRLREDLFYRLEVGMVDLPPLRERKEEIVELATWFMTRYQQQAGMKVYPLSKAIQQQLISYPWPGNIRMLENVIIRSLILQKAPGPLSELVFNDETGVSGTTAHSTASVPPANHHSDTAPLASLADKVEAYERQLVVEALKHTGNCVAEAARMLGISRGALQYKVKKYGITFHLVERPTSEA